MESGKVTPLNWRLVVVTSVVQFAEAFQLCVLMPIAPFMVSEFPGIPEEQIEFYSGLLVCSFVVGQLLSSYPVGILSDLYGEKLVILLSLLATFIFMVLFGFSTDYGTAYFVRFCTGLFNGIIGVLKTYLSKNSDSTNQGNAMALMSAAWLVGSMVAPAVGGFLARPVQQYPGWFSPDGIFGIFPYCLPTLASSLVLLASFGVTLAWMEDPVFNRTVALFLSALGFKMEGSPSTKEVNIFQEAKNSLKLSWEDFRLMLFSAVAYSIAGFQFTTMNVMFPQFCRSSLENGGLNFQTNQIGMFLSVLGAFEVLYIFFCFPWVLRTFDQMSIFRISLIMLIPVILSHPLANVLAITGPTWQLWIFFLPNLALRAIASTNVFTPVMVFLNNSVPKEYLGRANGIGQALAAGMRSIGPPMAGYIWGVTSRARYLLHGSVIFFFLAAVSFILLWMTFFYPKGIERSYEERKGIPK